MKKQQYKRDDDRERVAHEVADATPRGLWEDRRMRCEPAIRRVIDKYVEMGISMADLQIMQTEALEGTNRLLASTLRERKNAIRRKEKDGKLIPGLKSICALKATATQEMKLLKQITELMNPNGDVGKKPARLPDGMSEQEIIARVQARGTDEIVST